MGRFPSVFIRENPLSIRGSSHRRDHFKLNRDRRRQRADLNCRARRIRFAGSGKIFGVEFVVDREIFFHVREKDRHIDDVLPGRAGVFENEPHVFEHGATLRFDVVARRCCRPNQASRRGFPCCRAHAVRCRRETENRRLVWRAGMRPPVRARANFQTIRSLQNFSQPQINTDETQIRCKMFRIQKSVQICVYPWLLIFFRVLFRRLFFAQGDHRIDARGAAGGDIASD